MLKVTLLSWLLQACLNRLHCNYIKVTANRGYKRLLTIKKTSRKKKCNIAKLQKLLSDSPHPRKSVSPGLNNEFLKSWRKAWASHTNRQTLWITCSCNLKAIPQEKRAKALFIRPQVLNHICHTCQKKKIEIEELDKNVPPMLSTQTLLHSVPIEM